MPNKKGRPPGTGGNLIVVTSGQPQYHSLNKYASRNQTKPHKRQAVEIEETIDNPIEVPPAAVPALQSPVGLESAHAEPPPETLQPSAGTTLTSGTYENDPMFEPFVPSNYYPCILKQWLQVAHGCLPRALPGQSSQQATYCIPGYLTPGQLARDSFFFPSFRLVKCMDSVLQLAYWCTCTSNQKAVGVVLSDCDKPHWSTEQVQACCTPCEHISALLVICEWAGNKSPAALAQPVERLDSLTEEYGDAVQLSYGSLGTGLAAAVVVDASSADPVVLIAKGSGWRCTRCRADVSCPHARKLQAMDRFDTVDELQDDFPAKHQSWFDTLLERFVDPVTGKLRATCISKGLIPEISLDVTDAEGARQFNFPEVCSPAFADTDCCSCGRFWKAAAERVVPNTAGKSTVFHQTAYKLVNVMERVCSCGEQLSYDGISDGILNLNNIDLFSLDLLKWHTIQMTTSCMPFFAQWRTVVGMYAAGLNADERKRFMNKRTSFEHAWFNYVALQDVDYASNAYRCKCEIDGQHPVIICDGILLGTKKSKSHIVKPWAPAADAEEVAGSLHRDRVLICSAKTRAVLRRFFSRPPVAKDRGLLEAEYLSLKADGALDVLAPYMDNPVRVLSAAQTHMFADQSKPSVSEMLRALVSDSPVCALLPDAACPIIERLVHPSNEIRFLQPQEARWLTDNCPLVYKFIAAETSSSSGVLCCRAVLLLQLLVRICAAAFVPSVIDDYHQSSKERSDRQDDSSSLSTDSGTWSATEMFLRTGFYYPSKPVIRHLRNQCIGFNIMHHAESPRTIFEVLYTRWPEAPEVVAYDNSCHAHTYALNREPQWCRHSRYFIDKTHFKAHTGCACSYDIGRHLSLATMNSQLAEQRNAKLDMLKKHCAYMTQPMFLVYVRHFLYMEYKMRMAGL